MLIKTKVLVPYVTALAGFPFLALYSYIFGIISSDFLSLVWLIVLFEIMIATLFLMHIIYNSQEKSLVIIPSPKKNLTVEEKHLTH